MTVLFVICACRSSVDRDGCLINRNHSRFGPGGLVDKILHTPDRSPAHCFYLKTFVFGGDGLPKKRNQFLRPLYFSSSNSLVIFSISFVFSEIREERSLPISLILAAISFSILTISSWIDFASSVHTFSISF